MPISMQTQTPLVSTSSTPPEPDPEGPLLDQRPPVVVRGGEDLVAAVPYLIGFPPERSLVVVSLRRDGARSVLGVIARYDLPPATGRRKQQQEGTAAAAKQLVAQAVDLLRRDDAEQVVALIYDAGPCSEQPPWRRLVDRLDAALRVTGLVLLDALFVAEPRFRSYRCIDPGCCPSQGRLADTTASGVAAQLAARGGRRMASRAELRATVRAADRERCAAVESAARRELTDIGRYWAEDDTPQWRAWQLRSLQVLGTVARRYLSGDPRLEDDEAGRIIAGLADATVRDAAAVLHTCWAQQWDDDCAAEVTPADDEQADDEPADDEQADHASAGSRLDRESARWEAVHPPGARRLGSRLTQLVEAVQADDEPTDELRGDGRDRLLEAMWVDLASCCDGPLAAAPLTLLGLHVWSQGNGTLAAAAADRALEVAPEYRLALLLERALTMGMRPARLGERPVRRAGTADRGSGCADAPLSAQT